MQQGDIIIYSSANKPYIGKLGHKIGTKMWVIIPLQKRTATVIRCANKIVALETFIKAVDICKKI